MDGRIIGRTLIVVTILFGGQVAAADRPRQVVDGYQALEYAALAVRAGDLPRARRWLETAESLGKPKSDRYGTFESRRALIHLATGGDTSDPFDALLTGLGQPGMGVFQLATNPLWRSLYRTSAIEHGYPRFAAYLGEAEYRLQWVAHGPSVKTPPRLKPIQEWDEAPLPVEQSAPSSAERSPSKDAKPRPEWTRRLPPGELVRFEQIGEHIVAITASQDLDPVGEVSTGGYWISLSADSGKRFEAPLYTGLSVLLPYVVTGESPHPLRHKDELQIAVSAWALDLDSITFPPVGLDISEARSHRMLRMPLSTLRQDTDGDGLTDIAERAMRLDPLAVDSDGDGLSDGQDPLPNVAFVPDRTPRAAALAAALDAILGMPSRAIVTTSPHQGDPEMSHPITPLTSWDGGQGAQFIVGNPADFAGLVPGERVVVLSEMEAEEIAQARGVFLPLRIPLFELNRAGDAGVFAWDRVWTLGVLHLSRQDGEWIVEVVSHIVT